MSLRGSGLFLAAAIAFPVLFAQNPKKTPPQAPISGALLYRSYCASCHGERAKGDGPAAQSLNMKPTDLTLLAKKNQGKFPVFQVERILGGDLELPVHGSRTMPVWGPAFNQRAQSREKVRRLVDYLISIQEKPGTVPQGKE